MKSFTTARGEDGPPLAQPADGRATSRALRWLGLGLATSFATFQASLLTISVVGGLWTSGPTAVVYGRSMNPVLDRGDVVLNETVDTAAATLGSIVLYSSEGRLVTHRVIDVVDGKVQTKGDANATADSTWQPVENLQGQVRLVVPFIGMPRVWWREANWLYLGLWIVAAGAAFNLSLWLPPDVDGLEPHASTRRTRQ